ncbi:MAG: 3'-5' exonuclease [Bradyrhizobium sp.]|nr:3'-5' exonuclease [Bradyrhizobium sp.]
MINTTEDTTRDLVVDGDNKGHISNEMKSDIQAAKGARTKRAIILNCITTGLDPNGGGDCEADEIVDLGLLPVDFTDDFRIVRVGTRYQSLRQPAKAIPPGIEALTGITSATVEGREIDFDHVSLLVEGADWIVAHDAKFNRRFAERLHPTAFTAKPWACSWMELDWPDRGRAYQINPLGCFRENPRALDDCYALLERLMQPLGKSKVPALGDLIERAQKLTVRLWAFGAPFEKNGLLKARNYRWNSGSNGMPRAWFMDVSESTGEAEIAFLRASIFGSGWIPRRSLLTAYDRFSDRV